MTHDREPAPEGRWGALLCRAAAGDRPAFALLAAELGPYLTARLRRFPHTRALFRIPDDVEDAVQDTLALVWQKRSAFDPRRRAAAWLWVLGRNCAVNILRRRGRRRALSLHDRDGRLRDGLAVDAADPAALAAAAEGHHRLRRAVARALWAAEPRARHAWHWRVRKGRPYAAISHRLGVPQGTVATWICRLRRGIRQAVAPSFGMTPKHFR